jgi:regulator of protease activity HflC (stomatin/prohibitin superfamily)
MPHSYRIARRTTTTRVRIHPTLEWTTLTYTDDPQAALRALVRTQVPRLVGRVPLTLNTYRRSDGVEEGGPGVVLRRLEEQLVRGTEWETVALRRAC